MVAGIAQASCHRQILRRMAFSRHAIFAVSTSLPTIGVALLDQSLFRPQGQGPLRGLLRPAYTFASRPDRDQEY
jgi:hypothetical protein